jgi:hypothetical protein
MPEYIPQEISSLTGLVDSYVIWENENQPPRGHERYHPSAFGKCLRLMQYQRYEERGWVKGEPETHEPFLCRVFGNGHSMHHRWSKYFEGLGVLKGYWECRNPFCRNYDEEGTPYGVVDIAKWNFKENRPRIYGKDQLQGCFKPEKCVCGFNKFNYHETDVVSEELNFYGHADGILDFSRFDPERFKIKKRLYDPEALPKRPIVMDMKSINHFGFQDLVKGEPHDYYRVQLMIYCNVLDCEYGALIYENKNNQRLAAYRIDASPDHLWPWVVKQAKLMQEAADAVDENGEPLMPLPPPRPGSPDEKDCTYCSYRKICHDSAIWSDPEFNQKRKEFYGDLL